MNKKVIKHLYADIVSKDPYRQGLMGVHFEADYCCATDTHMLVIYKEGNAKLAGQTIMADGTEITRANDKGEKLPVNYPDIKRVIPPTKEENAVDINLNQLLAALKYHRKNPETHKDDKIAFGDSYFNIEYLARILNIYQIAGELTICKFFINPDARPALFESPSLTSVLMPVTGGESIDVDGERIVDSPVVLSYETVVNNYAFNSWRKEEKPADLAWLD